MNVLQRIRIGRFRKPVKKENDPPGASGAKALHADEAEIAELRRKAKEASAYYRTLLTRWRF